MKQASAQGVRRWQGDSAKRSGRWGHLPVDADAPLLNIRTQARNLSAPFWAKFLNSEQLLRKIIPVLIGLLLLSVIIARSLSLMTAASDIQDAAKIQLTLITELTAQELAENASLRTAITTPTLASVFLDDALPSIGLKNGQQAFLLNGKGKVIASAPVAQHLHGISLNRLTGGGVLMALAGSSTQTGDFSLDGQKAAYGAYTAISVGGATIGGLLLAQDQRILYANWRHDLKLNVTLFIALSSVLCVIVYAYFAQGSRARDTDQLYMETNARFDTALLRGHCGLWDWDLSRGRIVWSRSMYQMLGRKPSGRMMGFGDLKDLLHPDDPDMLTLANHAFQANEQQIDHRFRMMHSSGSWVWLRLRAELVRYKRRDPHMIGIAIDITEEEDLKRRSKNADIRVRDAIENISEAFVLWDNRQRLVMCNSKYQQLFNLPASAVRNGTHRDEIDSLSTKPSIVRQISTDSKSDTMSDTFEAQTDKGRWLQFSERRTQDGGFVSVGTDITQIKRNQKSLLESQESHMQTIADLREAQANLKRREQKLVEIAENLNEEKERADAANIAKSEFLANISHELRTPLNAIIGFSDIMRAKMFGELGSAKYDEYADDIHDSGSFLLGVINDVLDMSKIEAGRFQLAPQTVHLHKILQETSRIIQVQADEAGIEVEQKIPKTLEIEADRRAVKQILLNLLSNAVKFTPKGGRIEVTAKALKHSVNIIINDTGIGIDPEALARLGQPFEQVQDQFTKNHKGSGLGLAIAKSLTMLHGGTLDIKSVVGEGTTVIVRLPLECQLEKERGADA